MMPISHKNARRAHPRTALELTVQWSSPVDRELKAVLPKARVTQWVRAALDARHVLDAQIGLQWLREAEARALNRSFRGKNYATNVLTFDYTHAPMLHADIAICTDVLRQEAGARNIEQHAAHLVIHGVLHAQGYDHERGQRDAREMENLEMLLLHSLGFGNPYAAA